ncbi:MAG: hypothetical protein AB8B96_16470 [Lysobacterales bacterium]
MDWLTPEIAALSVTAITIAFAHTLLGPDHYLPFVALSKARRWSLKKTLGITTICGLGHAAGSVLLGFVGIALGTALTTMTGIENWRGDLAAWGLTAFGLIYLAISIKRLGRKRSHSHHHAHGDGTVHDHPHDHHGQHAHPHTENGNNRQVSWTIFIVFVLGPCEALIPLLMVPASQNNMPGVWLVTSLFVLVTLMTMLAAVALSLVGLRQVKLPAIERYSGVIAGAAICFCGVAMVAGL